MHAAKPFNFQQTSEGTAASAKATRQSRAQASAEKRKARRGDRRDGRTSQKRRSSSGVVRCRSTPINAVLLRDSSESSMTGESRRNDKYKIRGTGKPFGWVGISIRSAVGSYSGLDDYQPEACSADGEADSGRGCPGCSKFPVYSRVGSSSGYVTSSNRLRDGTVGRAGIRQKQRVYICCTSPNSELVLSRATFNSGL